ncbi:hypothetical protein I302_100854 [Kwoniella bestiolae CBS 10118]|uniref:BRCT domain-containing protein n=1 Tax=Kwoniella bestiolae CBS 10118 TaxID=1296100 RepID=A0A1B9G6B3_9TREE|nr:hypothetical protein I302_04227 [Kwoniella bestiolae CBS 10118]OCF26541.1 hypothetical protein I302_04227 [Kwoniella bestiolae CBS 10118]
MRRPRPVQLSRSPMPPESQSQTQDSTQQPSIEVLPSSPVTPLPTPAGQSDPLEDSIAPETSLSNGAGVSGSSVEETGDSGLGWTQSQIQHNQKVEAEAEAAKPDGHQEGIGGTREKSEDGVITSPENRSPLPRWKTKSPSPAPRAPIQPSSPGPTVDVDELEESAFNEIAGGLEETEVDTQTPHVQTPEQSQPPSTPPSHPRNLPQPPTIPQVVNSSRQLKSITSFSPTKLHHTMSSPNSERSRSSRAVTTSPIKHFGSKLSRSSRRNHQESQESEESLFAKDLVPRKPKDPLSQFNGIMSRNQSRNLEVPYSRDHSKVLSAIPTEEEEEVEHRPPKRSIAAGDNDGDTDKDLDDEEEADEDSLNWDDPIERTGDDLVGVNLDVSPPAISLRPHAEAEAQAGSPSPPSNPQHNGNQSRFGALGDSESLPSQRANDSQLFSESGEEVADVPESQHSLPPFAATQVMRHPSSPLFPSPHEEPIQEAAYEPTQPDETQPNEPEEANGDNTDNDEPPKSPSPPRPNLSRAASNSSTASKISVPTHRQLVRRSRVDDGSYIAPFKFVGPPNLPATELPTNSNALQSKPNRSELALAPPSSSPFGQAQHHRTSSEPAVLQETFKDSLEKESSSSRGRSANENPLKDQTVSSPPLRMDGDLTTPPEDPSSPFRPAPSPSSPSLAATRHTDPPALPTVLEETQKNSPTQRSSPCLPPVRPIKTSPKQYTSRNKRKRISSTPPVGTADGSDTDSSGDTPIGEDDHTYQPAPANKKQKKSYAVSTPSSRHAASPGTDVILSSKRKRNPTVRSSSLSSDGESSSSAAEDLEDNTYQPSFVPKIKLKLEKGKGKEKISAPNSSTSSRPPTTKKAKTNAQVARLSPSVSNTSVPTASSTPTSVPVLAAFYQRYYAGKATWTGKGYKVNFEDGEKRDHIKPDQMRKLVLKKGDHLEACTDSEFPAKFQVDEDWDGNVEGVKCCSLDGEKLGRVGLNLFGISNRVIRAFFGDRLFEDPKKRINGVFGPAADRIAGPSRRTSVPRSPVKRANGFGDGSPAVSRRSASPTRVTSDKLKGMLFLITRGFPDEQAELTSSIRSAGGRIAATWEELFDRSSPGECGFSRNLAGTPFVILLGEGKEYTIITPKVMVALARGIPVLSALFIDDVMNNDETVDWRSYLISPGFSNYTEHYMSQVVDTNWGEDGWDVHTGGPIRGPLKGKKVLFVLPSAKNDYLKRLIPVCAYSMGVEEIHPIANLKSSEPAIQDPKWDYILFEDREYKEKPLPKWLSQEEDRLCNVHWLKQCLIMGAALPASLDVELVPEKDRKK